MEAREIDTGTTDLLASLDAGVLTLTMNRPEARNALTRAMTGALGTQLAAAEFDNAVKCIVLTGAGKGFCAGGDVKGMAASGDGTVGSNTIDGAIHRQRLNQRATAGNAASATADKAVRNSAAPGGRLHFGLRWQRDSGDTAFARATILERSAVIPRSKAPSPLSLCGAVHKVCHALALPKACGVCSTAVVSLLRKVRMPGQANPKRAKWLKRLGVAVLLYTVVGFLVLPAIIKWQMVKQLPVFTHRAAAVEAVRVNPYALSLTVRGLTLTEADGSTFASFSNLYVNFEACSSLLHWTLTFKEIQLGSPYGYVAILTNGQFNFANLLTNAPAKNASPPKPPPPVLVEALVITNGLVAVADFYRAVPFQTKFVPIDLRLTNFTTRPRTGRPYAFMASTGEGEYFNWSGSVGAFPPLSAGKFEHGGIDLKKYGTYSREFTQLDVRDGKMTVAATYAFALETNGLEFTVTNASVLITNLAVFAPDPAATNALVMIPSVVVRGAEANLQKRTAKVQTVETIGGSIFARRFRDGTLELLQLIAPPANRALSILNPPLTTNTAPSAPAAPWSVLIENIVVKDYAARVEDQQPPKPASIMADQIELTVKGFSLASNAPVTVQLSTRVNNTGAVKLEAQGTVLPVAMDLDLDVSAIDLRPFQPYVEQQQVKLAFTSGTVSTKGRASVALGDTNQLAAKFVGDVVLNDVAIVDQIAFQDFARWKQVAVRGIDFVLAPMSVKIREVACDDFAASVVMGTNQQLTALAVLPPTPTNAAPSALKPASGDLLPFPVQIDLLMLTNASIHLVDLSVQPNCRFDVQQFSGQSDQR